MKVSMHHCIYFWTIRLSWKILRSPPESFFWLFQIHPHRIAPSLGLKSVPHWLSMWLEMALQLSLLWCSDHGFSRIVSPQVPSLWCLSRRCWPTCRWKPHESHCQRAPDSMGSQSYHHTNAHWRYSDARLSWRDSNSARDWVFHWGVFSSFQNDAWRVWLPVGSFVWA